MGSLDTLHYQVHAAPKVLLHDHLDGGLRPETLAQLAVKHNYTGLPSTDPSVLAQWFRDTACSSTLDEYLTKFAHTTALMQTYDDLFRVACEAVEDVSADNVVYVEFRYAPALHIFANLTLDEVVQAVSDGLAEGTRRAATPVVARSLVTAMRNSPDWSEVAALAIRHRPSVAGFDIAGPEDGFPASRGTDVFAHLRNNNVHFTVHAGEAFGPAAIADAVHNCGAERLGHGVRLADMLTSLPDGTVELSELAAYVRDRRIPLELCPSSNVHTGAVPSLAQHPFDLLFRTDMRVTVNTDNRLMSNTTLTDEFMLLVDQFGYTLADVGRLTLNAAKSAFVDYETRTELVRDIILPGFSALGTKL